MFGRPDGFGSSDFAQIVDLFMLYRSIWVSGVDFIKIIDLLTEEGSTIDDFSSDIDLFASATRGVKCFH